METPMKTVGLIGSILAFMSLAIPSVFAEGIRDRAKCADLELSQALGEEVDAQDAADCASMKRARVAPPSRPKLGGEGGALPELLADIRPPQVEVQAHQSPPGWLERIPNKSGLLFGVGEGPTLQAAYGQAVVMIAGQLQVQIRSNSKSRQQLSTKAQIKNDREVGSSSTYQGDLSESVQMVIRGTIKDVEMIDTYVDPESGKYAVLAQLDIAVIKRRQEALVKSVHAILDRAALRLADAMRTDGVLNQEALFELLAVLEEVEVLGRSDIGRKVRDRWERAVRRFERLAKRAVRCVTAEISPPAEGEEGGNTVTVWLHCNGKGIARGKLKTWVDGGLTDIPATVETDAQGILRMNPRSLLGNKFIKVGFMHDFDGVRGSRIVSVRTPARSAQIELKAQQQATFVTKIDGISGDAAKQIRQAIESYALTKWGAHPIKRGPSALKAEVRLNFTAPFEVRGKVGLTLEGTIIVRGVDGVLFEEKLRAGVLAEDEESARKSAITSLSRTIARWR